MTAAIRIIEPGLYTTVQDRGRYGFQSAGVPVSGALDAESLAIANALVGNGAGEAALEVRYVGPALAVEAPQALAALAGTATGLEIERNGETLKVPACRSVLLRQDDVVRLRALSDSATAYIAFAGGIRVAQVMGSRSTYVRSGVGGFEGRRLEAGDRVPLATLAGAPPELTLPEPPPLALPPRIRTVAGPQEHRFTPEALMAFAQADWRIGARSDRMGIRLEGPKLAHQGGHDIVSDGTVTGSIQVPGNGQPIVLLADRQTTGGYPKIATVISADLPALGRARPGETVRFELIGIGEAAAVRARYRARLASITASLRPAAAQGLDLERLYSENCISGVFG